MAKKRVEATRERSSVLDALDLYHVEAVATWLRSQADAQDESLRALAGYVGDHPEDRSAAGQLAYRRAYVQTCRHLAGILRQHAAGRR